MFSYVSAYHLTMRSFRLYKQKSDVITGFLSSLKKIPVLILQGCVKADQPLKVPVCLVLN
jgi:hypothetical protein